MTGDGIGKPVKLGVSIEEHRGLTAVLDFTCSYPTVFVTVLYTSMNSRCKHSKM